MGNKIRIICFGILLLGTCLSVSLVDRYIPAGDEMLATDKWQTRSKGEGQALTKDGSFSLVAKSGGDYASVYQSLEIPAGKGKVLLSAGIRTEGVQQGAQPWEKARLVFAQNDKRGKWLRGDHVVISLTGTHNWQYYEKAFDIHPDAVTVRVVVELPRCPGTMAAQDVRLYPVRQVEGYEYWRYAVLGCWALFLSAVVAGMAGEMERGSFTILLFFAAAILFATQIPGDIKTRIYQIVTEHVVKLTGRHEESMIGSLIGNWGHFIFFLCFGLAAGGLMPRGSGTKICLNILIFAGGTEMAQTYVDGRTAMIADFLVDMAGGIAGLGLVYGLRGWKIAGMRF